MKYNLDRNAKFVSMLVPFAHLAAATTHTGIDTRGYDEMSILYHTGVAGATAESQLSVWESASQGTEASYASIAGLTPTQVTATAGTNTVGVLRMDLRKRKRYIRVKNVGDGTNAVTFGVAGVLTGAKTAPFAQPTGATVIGSV